MFDRLPESTDVPWSPESILSKNKLDLLNFLKTLVRWLDETYADISTNFNLVADGFNGGSTGSISTGATVAHGIGDAPTFVFVGSKETGVSDLYWTADATNITVNFSGGGSHDFWWGAILM